MLPALHRLGIAALGMKTLGGNGEAIKQGVVTAEECLRYVLSLPIAAIVSGIDSIESFVRISLLRSGSCR